MPVYEHITIKPADDRKGLAVFHTDGRFLAFVPRAEVVALLADLPEDEPVPTDPPAGD